MPGSDCFVRLPTPLLDAFLQAPLSGTQWRILLWVIRHTYGWHVSATRFSWYRIAHDTSLDRGGIVRGGARLVRARILRVQGNEVGIEEDPTQWEYSKLAPQRGEAENIAMTIVSDDARHPKAMTTGIASDDNEHRKRCQESALFRRAKDSSKERLKKYKDTGSGPNDDGRHRLLATAHTERRHIRRGGQTDSWEI